MFSDLTGSKAFTLMYARNRRSIMGWDALAMVSRIMKRLSDFTVIDYVLVIGVIAFVIRAIMPVVVPHSVLPTLGNLR